MGLQPYLAMTAAEFAACETPENIAWMSCHFSPADTGLSNLPDFLPQHALLIVDDSFPLQDHQPDRIARQLAALTEALKPEGIVLDLQRKSHAAHPVIASILKAVTCPVAVTEEYAKEHACAVFLSPDMHIPLPEAIKPWKNRQLWLDIPMGVQQITVDQQLCHAAPAMPSEEGAFPHADEVLHCHYRTWIAPDHILFTLTRTIQDHRDILQEAEQLGITHALTLYQEWKCR